MALCEICSYDFKGKSGLAVHKFRAHGIRRPGSKGKKYYDDHKDDPEYKVRNRANQRNYYHDHIEEPAFKDKWRRQWAKQSRRRWKDPNYRQQHSIRGKEYIRRVMADPVAHEHRKERCREYYKKEAKKLRASSLRYHRKWWGTFLAMYGNQCACCGETEKKFLTLDHINNDGNEERKRTSSRSNATYLWKYACDHFDKERYQILCYNCNMGKNRNKGICPHKAHGAQES